MYVPNILKCIKVGGLKDPQANKIIFLGDMIINVISEQEEAVKFHILI